MPAYSGSCHCGDVRFHIAAQITELTQCDCSLCRKKNATMAAVPQDAFTMLSDWKTVSLYQWNTGVARHYFCKRCGIYTFHKKRSMPDHYGINVNCLDDFDAGRVPIRAADGATMTVQAATARGEWPGPRIG